MYKYEFDSIASAREFYKLRRAGIAIVVAARVVGAVIIGLMHAIAETVRPFHIGSMTLV